MWVQLYTTDLKMFLHKCWDKAISCVGARLQKNCWIPFLSSYLSPFLSYTLLLFSFRKYLIIDQAFISSSWLLTVDTSAHFGSPYSRDVQKLWPYVHTLIYGGSTGKTNSAVGINSWTYVSLKDLLNITNYANFDSMLTKQPSGFDLASILMSVYIGECISYANISSPIYLISLVWFFNIRSMSLVTGNQSWEDGFAYSVLAKARLWAQMIRERTWWIFT